jgi:TolB-like protein
MIANSTFQYIQISILKITPFLLQNVCMCEGTKSVVCRTSSELANNSRIQRFQARVPEELCRAHLEKVRASATFARAEQLRRMVEWLGSRSLRTDAEPPTEKELGELVLKRKDFDPQTDSLVRKEMRRLREKLSLYYEREGVNDRIRIHSGGAYLFYFSWVECVRAPVQEGESPCLLILPLRAQADLNEQSTRLLDEVMAQLGEHGGAELVAPTTAFSYRGRSGDIRAFATECGADFVVEGSLDSRDAQLRATLWFVDGRSGRTERPGRFTASSLDDLAVLAAAWLLQRLFPNT